MATQTPPMSKKLLFRERKRFVATVIDFPGVKDLRKQLFHLVEVANHEGDVTKAFNHCSVPNPVDFQRDKHSRHRAAMSAPWAGLLHAAGPFFGPAAVSGNGSDENFE